MPSRYRHYLLFFIALLPAVVLRDFAFGRELHLLSMAAQAIDAGTWITFADHGVASPGTPPLYMWLLMLSRLLTGGWHAWVGGLLSLLPALGIMIVMDRWFRFDGVKCNTRLAGMMLATTSFFLVHSVCAGPEMLGAFFIVLSLYTFLRICKGGARRRARWLLPVWVFAAMLSSGVLGLIASLLPALVFLLRRKERVGIASAFAPCALLALLCGLWFAAVWLEGGADYLGDMLFREVFGRIRDSFVDDRYFFWYVPTLFFIFLPWCVLFLVAVWRGVRRRQLVTDTERLLYTAVWVNIVVLSLVSAKQDVYMLPIFPLAAYLAAAMLSRAGIGVTAKVWIGLVACAAVVAFPLSFVADGLVPAWCAGRLMIRLGYAVLGLGGAAALLFLFAGKPGRAIWLLSAGVLCAFFLGSFSYTQYRDAAGPSALAREARALAAESGAEGYLSYNDAGLADMDFLLGAEPANVPSFGQLERLDAEPSATVIIMPRSSIEDDPQVRELFSGRRITTVGRYRLVVAGGRTPGEGERGDASDPVTEIVTPDPRSL